MPNAKLIQRKSKLKKSYLSIYPKKSLRIGRARYAQTTRTVPPEKPHAEKPRTVNLRCVLRLSGSHKPGRHLKYERLTTRAMNQPPWPAHRALRVVQEGDLPEKAAVPQRQHRLAVVGHHRPHAPAESQVADRLPDRRPARRSSQPNESESLGTHRTAHSARM